MFSTSQQVSYGLLSQFYPPVPLCSSITSIFCARRNSPPPFIGRRHVPKDLQDPYQTPATVLRVPQSRPAPTYDLFPRYRFSERSGALTTIHDSVIPQWIRIVCKSKGPRAGHPRTRYTDATQRGSAKRSKLCSLARST